MIYRFNFYDGTSITVTKHQYSVLDAGIKAGAEWIEINNRNYKVSDIRRYGPEDAKPYKTVSDLGLPDIPVPKQLQDAYDRRTISRNQIKLISSKEKK